MEGREEAGWGDHDGEVNAGDEKEEGGREREREGVEVGSREGKWESGKGRCAVTGRRVLGGTEGLRRVIV